MAMRITYPNGSTEILARVTKVDTQNFHEGMYDFYDDRGTLLIQIDMHNQIKWELVDEPDEGE
ncbi:MAG: hypothetical protein ACMG6H_09665 [Acidobacteriota bacterium]